VVGCNAEQVRKSSYLVGKDFWLFQITGMTSLLDELKLALLSRYRHSIHIKIGCRDSAVHGGTTEKECDCLALIRDKRG